MMKRMKQLLFLCFLFGITFSSSTNSNSGSNSGSNANTCPTNICNAVYNDVRTVFREDDGDVIIPMNGEDCTDLKANCMGDSCLACKCPTTKDTYHNDKEKCESYPNNGKVFFARDGLAVDTSVSTMYFAKNTEGMIELRSVATDTQLPLVVEGNTVISECSLSGGGIKVNTMHDNWEETALDGYELAINNGSGFLMLNPASIKVQPKHLQGQLIELSFKCPGTKKLYFKVQGKAVNLKDCLDCDGNFEHLDFLAIPEFPKPTSNSDIAINPVINVLQKKGKDVSGCNVDNTETLPVSYYDTTPCSSVDVPGDDILYASGTNVMGRNLDPLNQNSVHWDTITNSVVKMHVSCSGNDFCVMFRLTDSSSICTGNPCLNGGTWTQNGLSSCKCVCPAGFVGVDCSIGHTCADNPCCDGATCTDNGDSYTCDCPAGKTGSTCCDHIDYCAGSPCADGATCTSNSVLLTFECTCPDGKTGKLCDEDIDYCADSPCADGATCTSNSETLSFDCACPDGKTGTLCDEDIDYCADSPCADGATCTSNSVLLTFECTCPDGKTGTLCDEDIDYCATIPCADGATCTSNSETLSFDCACPDGKTGTLCGEDIDYCVGSPCADGATCTSNSETLSFDCACPDGKTGILCDQDIDYCIGNTCADGATCTSNSRLLTFECSCPDGKTGTLCDQDIDYCAGNPCADDATCTSRELTYECTCAPGKTGRTCGEDIDYCSDSPCAERATCVSDSPRQTFSCSCPADRTGTSCETDLSPAVLALDDTRDPAALGQEDNSSDVPVLPIVYAFLGVLFVVVVVGGLAGLMYKKVYVPYRRRKGEKAVVPFDNQINDSSKHYNPMYFDCETSLAVGNEGVEDTKEECSSVVSTMLPKVPTVNSVSFENPLYQLQGEDNIYKLPHQDPVAKEDCDYEYIERRDSDASNGIYEELPEFEPESKVFANPAAQKSIYDTLEKNDDELNNGVYNTLEKSESKSPMITSIYSTLERNEEEDW